jgi:hypothetical protein
MTTGIEGRPMEARDVRTGATIALGCGVMGVLVALWIYWLVLPGVVLGVATAATWRPSQ